MVPLTHVRTPEEVTGVKSPDPENWTVPIESSERLQWSGVNTTTDNKHIPSGTLTFYCLKVASATYINLHLYILRYLVILFIGDVDP